MKKNQKGFAIIESILILLMVGLVIGGGYYVFKQREDADNSQPTSNKSKTTSTLEMYSRTTVVPKTWKEFKSDKYKISFSYPGDWTIHNNEAKKKIGVEESNVYSLNATEQLNICFLKSDESGSGGCRAQLTINNQPFEQSVAQVKEYERKNGGKLDVHQLTIDGHNAVRFMYAGNSKNSSSSDYFVDANNYTYALPTVYGSDNKDDISQETAKTILTIFESIRIK